MNPKYIDLARKGRVFAASGAATGTTIAAGHVAPPAAGAATMLSILNPHGSGMNLEIISGSIGHVSGTPGAGAFSWCSAYQETDVTGAEAVAIVRPLITSERKSAALAWSATTLTGSAVHKILKLFPSAPFAGALAATSEGTGRAAVEEVDGLIIVQPGWMLTLAPAATGTSHIVTCEIVFAEIDHPAFA